MLQLERAVVNLHEKDLADKEHIAKHTWLDEHNGTLEMLKQRTADFTGMSMSYSEPIQVLNYEIGGDFNWHYYSGVVIIINSYI